jgi:hypothetical protein
MNALERYFRKKGYCNIGEEVLDMKITIDLPNEIVKELEHIATKKGTDIKDVAESIVKLYTDRYRLHVEGVLRAVENAK